MDIIIVGYARCSSAEQSTSLEGQIDFLRTAMGAEKVFSEIASGSRGDRGELSQMLDFVRSGDVVVIQRLDRLARSIRDLLQIMDVLERRGIHLRSAAETIDTTSAVGRLIFHIFSALSEFELSLIRERTAVGLANARARGRLGGRPKKLTTEQISMMQTVYDSKSVSVADMCRQFGISRSTAYKYLQI